MIFDEATSSVDPQSEREIWGDDRPFVKDENAHRHLAQNVHDSECKLYLCTGQKGVVAQRGSHAELMQQGGLYRELVTRQQAMEVAE